MTAPVLETRNLTRRFGGLIAVDDLSLTLPGGKLHAIIGPNGAGKTTLFNLISGLLQPNAGQVLFRGRDITGLPAHEISRLGIKRTLQVKSVFAQLTVAENLWITFEGSKRFLHPLRDAESDPVARERVEQTLEQIGLAALARRQAGTLSYGDVALLEILEEGGSIHQETRLFDAKTGETRSMRSKEEAHDYRYFPDPDLLPLVLDPAWVDALRAALPELPDAKKALRG